MSIRASVYSAAASTYVVAAVQMVAMVITTRLMTPSDIGLYTIALSFLLLANGIADWGVNIYIVQRHADDMDSLRACSFVAWTGAVTIGGLMAAASGPVADFYSAPEIRPLMLLLSLRVLLYPFGLVSSAVIARDMRYKALAAMNISNAVVQGVVGVALVWAGARHLGLAAGYVAGFLAEVFWRAYYVPELFLVRPAVKGAGKVFRCGLPTTSVAVLNSLAQNVFALIIGYYLGPRDTGFFARANTLVSIVWRGVGGVINGVGIPAFSRAHMAGEDMAKTFISATCILTGIVWPLFALVLVLSEPIVLLLFGPAWVGIVPVGQLLCVANMIMAMSALSGALLLGIKRSGALLRREIMAQVLVIGFTLAGVQFGLMSVAGALVAAAAAQLMVTMSLLGGEIHLRWTAALQENYKSLAALAATCLGALAALPLTDGLPAFWRILAGSVTGGACWFFAVRLLRHPLNAELGRLRSLLERLRAGRAQQAEEEK